MQPDKSKFDSATVCKKKKKKQERDLSAQYQSHFVVLA